MGENELKVSWKNTYSQYDFIQFHSNIHTLCIPQHFTNSKNTKQF